LLKGEGRGPHPTAPFYIPKALNPPNNQILFLKELTVNGFFVVPPNPSPNPPAHKADISNVNRDIGYKYSVMQTISAAECQRSLHRHAIHCTVIQRQIKAAWRLEMQHAACTADIMYCAELRI
jgi:hypothetical protein